MCIDVIESAPHKGRVVDRQQFDEALLADLFRTLYLGKRSDVMEFRGKRKDSLGDDDTLHVTSRSYQKYHGSLGTVRTLQGSDVARGTGRRRTGSGDCPLKRSEITLELFGQIEKAGNGSTPNTSAPPEPRAVERMGAIKIETPNSPLTITARLI